MNYKKIIPLLSLLILGIFLQNTKAQKLNIERDTIFVNELGEFFIWFPTVPNNYATDPIDAPYEVRKSESKIVVMGKAENTMPVPLRVSEGGRNHLFILAYKKEIDFGNTATTSFDYSTVEKLKQHIQESAKAQSAGTKIPVVSTQPVDNSLKFNALMEKGNKDLAIQNYQGATLSFEEAHALRPDDPMPVQKLEEIKKMQAPVPSAPNPNDQKYFAFTTEGKFRLDQKNYEQARDAFKQALEVRPGDPYAKRRIDEIDKIIYQESYFKYIDQGDKAMAIDQFIEARVAYNQALVIRPNDVPATNRLKLVEKKEKENSQREELQKNYSSAMEAGARYFGAGDYESAKKEYNKANALIPGPKPQEEIRKINVIIDREGKISLRYTTLIKRADTEFDRSHYPEAKKLYGEASAIMPKENYPKERMVDIESIVKGIEEGKRLKSDSLAELRRREKEADLTARYEALMKSAEIEFDRSNYTKANKLYTDASALKPEENAPKERLLMIENILAINAAEKEKSRKYDQAISTAKSYYQNQDLTNAKLFYDEAAALKPLEAEHKAQLQRIIEILTERAITRKNDSIYAVKIALADSQRIAKEYEPAIITYNEALGLKPTDPYAKGQINFIQATRNSEALKRGDKATADKRWNDAISAYTEALSIHPNNEYALQGLKIATHQGQLAKTADSLAQAALVKAPVVPEKTKKQKRKKQPETEEPKIVKKEDTKPTENLEAQKTPITYTNEELKTKYPEFDFSVLPPDQPFNQTAVYNKDKESVQIYRTMVQEKPRLDLNYTDQDIKLICTGINFQESNAYIKILIQNYSKTDFLTGAMMVTWTKMAGNRIKLYPNHLYPSPLPVIKPGHEAALVYAFKTYDILDGETLNFELKDRPKGVTLQIKIPGTTFNKELARLK